MWFEDLGPVLAPLLSDLTEALGCHPLLLWILRVDGRHFLEESPPFQFLQSPRKIRRETSGSASEDSLFGPVEIFDSQQPRALTLVLESVYPERVRFRVGTQRDLPTDSPLYTVLDTESDPVQRAILPECTENVVPSLLKRELWVCRLEVSRQPIGVLGVPADSFPTDPARLLEIWYREEPKWALLQLESSLARRTETLEAVSAIGRTITSQLEIHDVLQSVVEEATVLMKAKVASLMLVDRETNELRLESVYGSSPDYIQKPSLSIDHSLLGRVVRSGKPLMVRDVQNCDQYAHRDLARSEGLVSLLSVPVKWQNACIGVLNVYSAYRYHYTTDNVFLLSILASQSAIAIQNARALNRTRILEDQVHELDKHSLVGELAASVAHEIRNPLSAIKMLMESWEPTNEVQKRDLGVISSQLEGINRCVTDLLETARPKPLGFSKVSLAEEVSTTLQMLRVRIRDQGILVDLRSEGGLPDVDVDVPRFRQLLINLVLNSLDAMPDSGRLSVVLEKMEPAEVEKLPGEVVVSPQSQTKDREQPKRNDAMVVLTLSDTGGGMGENEVVSMFEPFKSRRSDGFGLGLSVVKRVAEEHSSILKVHNVPGEGLTYFVAFPIEQAPRENLGPS